MDESALTSKSILCKFWMSMSRRPELYNSCASWAIVISGCGSWSLVPNSIVLMWVRFFDTSSCACPRTTERKTDVEIDREVERTKKTRTYLVGLFVAPLQRLSCFLQRFDKLGRRLWRLAKKRHNHVCDVPAETCSLQSPAT